jgi:anaerobic selenocysteine-containing dehydrogenase
VQFPSLAFDTPSGRIEISSPRAEANGLPRVPVPDGAGPPEAGRLRLLSPADAWLLNSSFGNVDRIVRRLRRPSIVLNPRDAGERHLADGQTALVHNECGRLELRVSVSTQVPPGVALAHKGRWLTATTGAANVNVLNAGLKSDMGESSAVHSVEVRVEALHASRVQPDPMRQIDGLDACNGRR